MSDQSGRAASIRRYVFYNVHRPSRAWMPTLERINDRFSQYLRTALLQHLRPVVEVTPPIAIQLVKHGEFMDRLTAPSHLTLVNFKPLRGAILIIVDAQLVGWIVESRFGGDGRFPLTIASELSSFEQKSAHRVVRHVIEQFALAWRPIGKFEPEITRHETNPQFAGIANPGELIIISSFDVRIGQGGGKLTICMPYVMLEPMHDQLVAGIVKQTVDHDPRWQQSLTMGLGRATIQVQVELARCEVTVRDLLSFRL